MAVTNAGGCAAGGPVPPATFSCQVQGAELLAPPSDGAAVCRRFQTALEQALGRSAGSASAGAGAGDALQVRLNIRRPGIASAVVTQTRAGRTITHPEVAVAVSDRGLGLGDVDQLAVEVARHIRYS